MVLIYRAVLLRQADSVRPRLGIIAGVAKLADALVLGTSS